MYLEAARLIHFLRSDQGGWRIRVKYTVTVVYTSRQSSTDYSSTAEDWQFYNVTLKINNFIGHFFRCLIISNYWKSLIKLIIIYTTVISILNPNPTLTHDHLQILLFSAMAGQCITPTVWVKFVYYPTEWLLLWVFILSVVRISQKFNITDVLGMSWACIFSSPHPERKLSFTNWLKGGQGTWPTLTLTTWCHQDSSRKLLKDAHPRYCSCTMRLNRDRTVTESNIKEPTKTVNRSLLSA